MARFRRPWRRLLVAAAALLTLATPAAAHADAGAGAVRPVTVEYFYGEECPYCQELGPRLTELAAREPAVQLESYEVWHDAANRERFAATAAAHGVEPSGVPTTFALGRVWVGHSEQQWSELEATLLAAAADAAPTPAGPQATEAVTLPLVGTVELGGSLLGTTAVIAFVDGFNPCSLWVLSVLLAMTLHARSRRRLVIVGATFLAVTAAVYGLFIGGLFSVLSYVAYVGWIQTAVALVALTFAAVAIKDYFWFRRGPSLTIPERFKPRIYAHSRGLARAELSTPALVGGTAALGVGVALVELPCTAGFPVIWTNALAVHGVETPAFLGLLGLYLGVYLLDELALFAVVVATLRIGRFQEHHGRVLKLLGGTVMLALAAALFLRPELLAGVSGTLAVFAAALLLAALLALLERLLRRPVRSRAGPTEPVPRPPTAGHAGSERRERAGR
jgi:hypothetical protein